MSKAHQRFFQFTDGENHNATITETTTGLDSLADYTWSITPISSGITGASPTYTLEVSNDNLTWFEYNKLSTNVAIVDAVDDIHLAWKFMRIVFNGTGTTAGTVKFQFTQKQKS